MQDDFYTQIRKGLLHIHKGIKHLERGPVDYSIKRLIEHSKALFSPRFCQWQPGLKVYISKKIKIESTSGWWHIRRTLRVGSTGTISTVEWRDGWFIIAFKPDVEWWYSSCDQEWKKAKPENHHVYYLSEKYLTLGDPNE